MAAKRVHRMTPKRRDALRKAQLASARKRRKPGSKASIRHKQKRVAAIKRKVGLTVKAGAILGTAAAGAYTWKNRERLVVRHAAVGISKFMVSARGGSKEAVAEVGALEKDAHARRSTFRVREYGQARRDYQLYHANARIYARNNPGYRPISYRAMRGKYVADAYAKGRHARAVHRLRRIQGKKIKGFSASSGHARIVFGGRVRKLPF